MESRSIRSYSFIVFCFLAAGGSSGAWAQSLGNAGTVAGTVVDASGAALPRAAITLHNALTNYTQSAVSGPDGTISNFLPLMRGSISRKRDL